MSKSQILLATVALIIFATGVATITLNKPGAPTGEPSVALNRSSHEYESERYWKARYLTLELASLLQSNSEVWNSQSLNRAESIAEALQATLVEIEAKEAADGSTKQNHSLAQATELIAQLKGICHDQRTCSQAQLATRLQQPSKLVEAINLQYPEVDLSVSAGQGKEKALDSPAPSSNGNLILVAVMMSCGAIIGAIILFDLKRQRRRDEPGAVE